MAVFEIIEGWYNPRWHHSAVGHLSPVNYERSLLPPLAQTHNREGNHDNSKEPFRVDTTKTIRAVKPSFVL